MYPTIRFALYCLTVFSARFILQRMYCLKFDLLDENDPAQNYDVFLFLTQSQFDLIVAQFMVITAVDGSDHYVILSD